MANQDKLWKCPECGKELKAATALGMHRRVAHGIIGSSEAARKYRESRASEGKPTTSHLPEKKKKEVALVKSKKEKAHRIGRPKGETNSHALQTVDDRDHRLQAAATFAAGRVQQLLEGIALQHDLPPRSLTALVLRVVHSQALR